MPEYLHMFDETDQGHLINDSGSINIIETDESRLNADSNSISSDLSCRRFCGGFNTVEGCTPCKKRHGESCNENGNIAH